MLLIIKIYLESEILNSIPDVCVCVLHLCVYLKGMYCLISQKTLVILLIIVKNK